LLFKFFTSKSLKGVVYRSTGSWYDVYDSNNIKYSCRLKGIFKIKGLKVTNPIAVGDWVEFEIEENSPNIGIINDIYPRKNYIIRKSVHKSAHGHLLATNIDQLLLMVTLGSPRTSLGFIDRLLVTAETFRIPVVIVFNKTDLLDDEWKETQDAIIYLYESIGYKCIKTSVVKNEGIDLVKVALKDKVSLLSGHSGVGKSSLLNLISPDLDLAISEISSFSDKGVHTTTFAEMFELYPGSYIIDSPGIKELGLMEIEKDELAHYFPEFRALLGECKFHNCRHINEPKCAIKDAVSEGKISESRYASYISMYNGEDNRR
jgi:ribosome biogenesis GTPase